MSATFSTTVTDNRKCPISRMDDVFHGKDENDVSARCRLACETGGADGVVDARPQATSSIPIYTIKSGFIFEKFGIFFS